MKYRRVLVGGLLAAAAITVLATRDVGTQVAVAPGTDCGTRVGQQPTWQHVTLVIFENKTQSQIIGNDADAPYLASLARACSYATNMNHMTATSLTNYIAMTSGYTGYSNGREVLITGTKNPPIWPQSSVSIFEAMGADAKQWAESMPSNCYMKSTTDFHVGHAPYQYYTRTQNTLCQQHSVPLSSGNPMSARLNLVIPNKANSMHGTTALNTSKLRIRAGDAWARNLIPTLLNSSQYRAGNSVIIVMFDEANEKTSKMPFIVVSPYTRAGGSTNVNYNHYSTLKGIQQMLGVTPLLGHAGDAGRTSIADDPVFGL
jgi:hypothetical protein